MNSHGLNLLQLYVDEDSGRTVRLIGDDKATEILTWEPIGHLGPQAPYTTDYFAAARFSVWSPVKVLRDQQRHQAAKAAGL